VCENLAVNVVATAGSTAAVSTAAIALGAFAASWTGIGLLVLLGVATGVALSKATRTVYRKLEEEWLKKTMHNNACDLLGLPRDDSSYHSKKVVEQRFRQISRYIHPDVAKCRDGDLTQMFALMTEAKHFLLAPGINYDLLANFTPPKDQ